MKILVVLFSLIGATFALVPGKEYLYSYEGRVGVGFPEIRNRASGAGIRCKIGLQVQTEEDVHIKLSEIEVGEYMGDVGCHIRDSMPINYRPIDGSGQTLTNDFIIHIHREEDNVMEVPKDDVEWITNIRKSIAGIFLIDPLRNNHPEVSDNPQQPYERVMENSIFGKCHGDYTLLRSNETRSRKSDPSRNETYAMTRTINFDSCYEVVGLQQTAIGNTTHGKENQFQDVSARASKVTANITYDGSRFTIRDGVTEGYVIVNPFGLDHDKLVSMNNQSYQLESIKDIKDKWQPETPLRSLKTWYMESASPFSPSESSPDWINFRGKADDLYSPLVEESISTGIDLTDADIENAKKRLDDRLEESAQILTIVDHPPARHNISPFDSESAVLVSHLESAFRTVRSLDQERTESLFDNYYKNDSHIAKLKYRLLIDCIGAAGTAGPLRVFVDETTKGRITPERAASIFFTLPNTLFSSPALPDLERYVKSLTLDNKPFATATVWINYANTLNKVCLNERRYKYANPHELFGKRACDSKTRLDSILPFFQEKLENATEDWQRIILIQVIGNIGTVQAHSTLVNIIQDRSQTDTVRVTAVYGLSRNKLPNGVREHVFKTLRPIVERRDEDPYVRQACIIALLSWRPPVSFYQSLALQTWREPSNNMASFIYFVLRSYADSTDPAIDRSSKASKFVLHIAKPFAPSFRFSDFSLYSRYSQQDQLATDFDISWLKRDRASQSFTREVFAFLLNSYGGLRFSVAQSSISFNKENIDALFRHMAQVLPQQYKNVRSSEHRRSQEALVDLQKRMIRRGKSGHEDFAIAFLSLFDDMELMLPLSKDPLMKALGQDGQKLFNEVLKDDKFHGTKFINPGPISLLLPSETGLPIHVRFSVPTINGGEANVTLTADGQKCTSISQLLKAKEIRLDLETNYRLASKQFTMVRAIMPWSQRVAMAGVESFKALNLPANISLDFDRRSDQKNISLSFTPRHFEEFPLVQVHTVPFVATKVMWPGYPIPTQADSKDEEKDRYQLVSISGQTEGSNLRERPLNMSYTGISGTYYYEGDGASPYTLGNYIDLMRRPEEIPSLFGSPTCRMFESSIKLDFGKSETKEIHSSFAFYVKRNGEPNSRKKSAFTDKLRDPQPDFEFDSNLMFKSDKQTRYYEASLSMKHDDQGDKEITQFSYLYGRNPVPNIDPKPRSYCADVKRTAPKIRSLDDLRKVLHSSSDIEADYEGTLRGGVDCNEKTIGKLNAKVSVSEERKQHLQKELDDTCNADPVKPMAHFNTDPVYDQATVDITYQEPVPRDVLNQTYHFYDYVRGFTFPHVYFNYMDQNNPRGKISVRGRRYLGERRWEVRAELPTETMRFDRFKMPKMIESIVPVGGIADRSDKIDSGSLVLDAQLSQDCVITKSKIRVFDGFSYNYALDNCQTYAVMNREDKHEPSLSVAIDDPKTGYLKAMISSDGTGTTILFNSKIMWLNGREVGLTHESKVLKTTDNKYMAEALKTESYIEVKVPGNFTVRLSDEKITVTPSNNMRDKVGGLCGDFNGAIHRELIGEERCIYSDPKLFGNSWSQYVGEYCDLHTYQREQKLVKQFRKSCEKIPVEEMRDTSILPKYSQFPHDCLEYVYKVKKNGEAFCVTKDVVAMCYPLCKLDKPVYNNELYDCWPEVAAPKEIARNLKRGYIRHKITKRPEIFSSFKTEHAVICSRK